MVGGRVTSWEVDRYVTASCPACGSTGPCCSTRGRRARFVVDRVCPVVVASPCSGHGAGFAALIGELAADLALGTGEAEPRFALEGSTSMV